MKKLLLTLILAISAVAPKAVAQEATYKFDLGAHLGLAGYLGDVSRNMFASPGIAGGVSFRYIHNVRWSIRSVFNAMSLSGNSSSMKEVFPSGTDYSFSATVCDLDGRFEFNFFPYGIGETYKQLKRWTPYIAVGVGVSVSHCEKQTYAGFNIPMAVGFKYKIFPRLNLGLEFLMTKVFSDHMDGQLSDLYQIRSSFLKNTDWYSNFAVSLTYEFGERCPTCHYLD